MAKVCLISVDGNNLILPLRYMSTALKSKGHKARVIALPQNARYDRETFFSLDEFLDETYPQTIIEQLIEKTKGFDMIGVTSYAMARKRAFQVINNVKPLKIPIIWGGKYATTNPEDCIKHADMVCVGDGEEAIVELAESLERTGEFDKTTKNIWFNSNGTVIKNPVRGLGEFSIAPDYSFEDHHTIENGKIVAMEVRHLVKHLYYQASRGCPFGCTYCTNRAFLEIYKGKGGYFSTKKVEKVIEELIILTTKLKPIDEIWFVDDDFFLRPLEDIRKFGRLYKECIGIPFRAYGNPRSVTDEKMKFLVDAGLFRITIGVQSGSHKLNKEVYKRNVTEEDVTKTAHTINKYMKSKQLKRVMYQFIADNPYEEEEDVLASIDLIQKIPPPCSIEVFSVVLFPGSELYKMAVSDGVVGKYIEKGELNYNDYRIFSVRNKNEYYNKLLHCLAGESTIFWKGSIPTTLIPHMLSRRFMKFKNKIASLIYLLQFFWNYPEVEEQLYRKIRLKI